MLQAVDDTEIQVLLYSLWCFYGFNITDVPACQGEMKVSLAPVNF